MQLKQFKKEVKVFANVIVRALELLEKEKIDSQVVYNSLKDDIVNFQQRVGYIQRFK